MYVAGAVRSSLALFLFFHFFSFVLWILLFFWNTHIHMIIMHTTFAVYAYFIVSISKTHKN